MTLHEIEETLNDLAKRHQGLDEALLVTLLRAGGWEEKNIEEARTLFRLDSFNKEILPPLQEEPLLPSPVDAEHLLTEASTKDIEVPTSFRAHISQMEPESLVTPSEVKPAQKDEFPHNLPLRPFETSEHVWPFSRYRDVFYGESEIADMVPTPQQEKEIIQPKQEVASPVETPVVVLQEEKVEPRIGQEVPVFISPTPPIERQAESSLPARQGDEKLVMLASIMLLVVLLLLGYMYGNGRL